MLFLAQSTQFKVLLIEFSVKHVNVHKKLHSLYAVPFDVECQKCARTDANKPKPNQRCCSHVIVFRFSVFFMQVGGLASIHGISRKKNEYS